MASPRDWRALRAIAPALDRSLLPAAVLIAVVDRGSARATVRVNQVLAGRSRVVRARALSGALRAVGAIQRETVRWSVLRELLPSLGREHVSDVLRIAARFETPSIRVAALEALARRLSLTRMPSAERTRIIVRLARHLLRARRVASAAKQRRSSLVRQATAKKGRRPRRPEPEAGGSDRPAAPGGAPRAPGFGFVELDNRYFVAPEEPWWLVGALAGYASSAHAVPPPLLPGRRVVNTGFADAGAPDTRLSRSTALVAGKSYAFIVEVGDVQSWAIDVRPAELPPDLTSGMELVVVVFPLDSSDGQFTVAADARIGRLRIDRDGSVVVAQQPGDSTPLSPDARSTVLSFPVTAPDIPGTARLRCNIYYRQTLLQSHLVAALVRPAHADVADALVTTADYVLSRAFSVQTLAPFPPHRLSLLVNQNANGTHGFYFFGEQDFHHDATLDMGLIQGALDNGREALHMTAWGTRGEWDGQAAYRYADGRRDRARLTTDLARLAGSGYRLYTTIINRLAGGKPARLQLEALMRTPGLVQIALKETPRFVLPAALFYDYPIDSNVVSLDQYQLCPAFGAALDAGSDLTTTECFRGACPSAADKTVVCPSGFWGYRHRIGLPLSVVDGPDSVSEIRRTERVSFAIGVSTDATLLLRPAHVTTLKGFPNLDWHYADTRSDVLDALKTSIPHVVYFYCHGGLTESRVPYIQVGPRTERGITRDNIEAAQIDWTTTRPLVFMNGCHTTALAPENAFEFVSGFVENAFASGVIGTETTVFEPLARSFAESCLRQFMSGGVAIGDCIRSARLELLSAGNPLGLVYIPFVLAGLKIVP